MKIRMLQTGMLALAMLTTGCVTKVFNDPVAISTKPNVYRHAKPIRQVKYEYTNYFFVLIPIVKDPRDAWDKLLAEAKAAGGNAVIDVQVKASDSFMWMFPPICVVNFELTGTAATLE